MKNNLALYIHIPFCKSKCAYCSFISFPAGKEVMENYIDALVSEILLTSKTYKNKKVDTIFLGGGTPSFLPVGSILKIMSAVKQNFDVASKAEITIECNPDSITKEKLQEYKMAGINRISIGFQSASDRLLKLLNRPHTKEEFLNALALVKETKFENINADLMLGLPTQSLRDLKASIRLLIKQKVTHISVYDLILEEGTPLYNKVKSHEYKEISEKLNLKMQNYVLKALKKAVFKRYEVSNYAKEGYECKHNLKYWDLDDYLGIGLAAHSKIGNTRFNNTEVLDTYLKNIENKKLEYEELIELTIEEQKEEFIMLGLRKTIGIDLTEYSKLFNENLIKLKQKAVEEFLIKGFIRFNGTFMYLTEKGMQVLNKIVLELTS
ncbi:MAG: radical SAM family heme chaperone HemW [Spirochaetales bacterium]